jgi:hypothetical protein
MVDVAGKYARKHPRDEAATQGSLDGKGQCRRICTDTICRVRRNIVEIAASLC